MNLMRCHKLPELGPDALAVLGAGVLCVVLWWWLTKKRKRPPPPPPET